MASKLKKYFPMIQERQEILAKIHSNNTLHTEFKSWPINQQAEFLNICTGVKGLKLLYDGFFKEIMNPEYAPERLNDFLSHMLCQKIKILRILPNDSTRLTDEASLLITDIVVELEDRSIANIEMQKIGYLFPGQRSACYSADLLLRQYKRVRSEKKKHFNYHDIKNVYTIVLFEKSPKEFHTYPHTYYHFFEHKSDTGLKMELLQKYLFVPLDIFRKSQQNKGINSKRDAWLTLFSCDESDTIIALIKAYPEFIKIYEEAYTICLNIERMMEMFSEELAILDRNTAKYMMDEMQGTIDNMQTTIDGMQGTINGMQGTIDGIQEKYTQALKSTVNMLRKLKIPETEIITRICEEFQMEETQVQQYL